MRRTLGPFLIASAILFANAASALALPVLELDIRGGTYVTTRDQNDPFHNDTYTIVGQSDPFTLYAIGTPQGQTTASALLSDTWYISAAVSPMTGPPGGDLGYFTFNGSQVNVTSDMVYGKPPVEAIESLQGFDKGDLQGHEIYPTYFQEFQFQFSPTQRNDTYDSAQRAMTGGPDLTPSATGGSYYQAFTIDTSHLNPNYVLHFDLYNERVRSCDAEARALNGGALGCTDVDINSFADFHYDAQSPPPVPEPMTMLLLGTGLAGGAFRKWRQSRLG
jgi:hypothetical protein